LERIASVCRARVSEEPNPPAPFPRREGGEQHSAEPDSIPARGMLRAGTPPSLLGKGAGGLGSAEGTPR
jgi:hypothetical protein